MEPDMDDLLALMRGGADAKGDAANRLRTFADRTSDEGRALELAICSIEALRERGSLTGADVCRLAALLGFDSGAIARAWNTRAEFDFAKTSYRFDAPIARVLPLPRD